MSINNLSSEFQTYDLSHKLSEFKTYDLPFRKYYFFMWITILIIDNKPVIKYIISLGNLSLCHSKVLKLSKYHLEIHYCSNATLKLF
jgi:hypothetical protein